MATRKGTIGHSEARGLQPDRGADQTPHCARVKDPGERRNAKTGSWLAQDVQLVLRVVDEVEGAAIPGEGQAEQRPGSTWADRLLPDLGSRRTDLDQIAVTPVDRQQVPIGRRGETKGRVQSPTARDRVAHTPRVGPEDGEGDGRDAVIERVGDVERALRLSATPVGPMTSAPELSSSGKPEAMTDVANILGTPAGGVKRMRSGDGALVDDRPPAPRCR